MNFNQVISKMPNDAILARIPEKTISYAPVKHEEYVEIVMSHIDNLGYDVKDASFQVANKGKKMVGTITLETKDGINWINPSVVIRNSYDKSMSLGIGAGNGTVFVCTNGVISGDVVSLRKHTSNVYRDIEDVVQNSIQSMEDRYLDLVNDLDRTKDMELTKLHVHNIIGELFLEQKILTTAQLNIVRNELYYSENFKMLNGGDMSMYNMYNNITEALKISHPMNYVRDHTKVHEYLTNY